MLYQESDNIEVEPYEIGEAEYETGRFAWMDIVSRRWASLLETTLYEQLGLLFDVQAQQVVWMRFGNLLQHVRTQPIYILEVNQTARGVLILDNAFVQSTMAKHIPEGQDVDLEQFMSQSHGTLQKLLESMGQDFEKSWTRINDFSLRFKRVTTSKHRARVLLPHERCLILRLTFQTADSGASEVILALPFTAMHKTLRRLESGKVLAPESVDSYYEGIEEQLQRLLTGAQHELVAEMGTVDLREAGGTLRPGQVLPLHNSGGKVLVRLNGRPALIAKMGQSQKHYAVQVLSWEPARLGSALKQPESGFEAIDLPENQ